MNALINEILRGPRIVFFNKFPSPPLSGHKLGMQVLFSYISWSDPHIWLVEAGEHEKQRNNTQFSRKTYTILSRQGGESGKCWPTWGRSWKEYQSFSPSCTESARGMRGKGQRTQARKGEQQLYISEETSEALCAEVHQLRKIWSPQPVVEAERIYAL